MKCYFSPRQFIHREFICLSRCSAVCPRAPQLRAAGERFRHFGVSQQTGPLGCRRPIRPAYAQTLLSVFLQEANQNGGERATVSTCRLPYQTWFRHDERQSQRSLNRGKRNSPLYFMLKNVRDKTMN